jgi:hypothetical protein
MKTIDFSQPGGFPLTQDTLGYLQEGYMEALDMLAKVADTGAPIKLWGMVQGPPVGGGTAIGNISDGAFYYNGQLYKFTGGDYGSISDDIIVVIADNASSLTFFDASTPNVVFNNNATFADLPTVTDATHFPYSSMVTFGVGLGLANREYGWNDISVGYSGGGEPDISGHIYYKRNLMSNQLELRIELLLTNVGNISGVPGACVIGTLPLGYRLGGGSTETYIIGSTTDPFLKDFTGTYPINAVTFLLFGAASGDILVFPQRSESDTDYGITLHFVGSLDV